ncbi:MAG: class I SAM-dependent methyltransferase [Alphaproteobacteria bacterium]
MKDRLKKSLKKNLEFVIFLYIFNNILIHIRRSLKNIKTTSGSTHQSLPLKDSIQYITGVFTDYQRVSDQKTFKGKLAELGPGDSNGVALLFLAHGASHVDLADRFYSVRDDFHHTEIEQYLVKKYPSLKKFYPKFNQYCVRYYGQEASGEHFFDIHQSYDHIISRSVLEHVDDPELVLRKMYGALNPSGMLIHKVDLRDHGMLTPLNHSLRFLEIPEFFYKLMTYGSGYPNRFLFHKYREVLTALNPSTKFYVAGLHGVDPFDAIYPIEAIPTLLKTKAISFVNEHRHKFSKEFSNLPAEDLIISSFFFVCKKKI